MSKRGIVILVAIVIVAAACWYLSRPLLDAFVAMHHRGGS